MNFALFIVLFYSIIPLIILYFIKNKYKKYENIENDKYLNVSEVILKINEFNGNKIDDEDILKSKLLKDIAMSIYEVCGFNYKFKKILRYVLQVLIISTAASVCFRFQLTFNFGLFLLITISIMQILLISIEFNSNSKLIKILENDDILSKKDIIKVKRILNAFSIMQVI